jgi:hypothetical protein
MISWRDRNPRPIQRKATVNPRGALRLADPTYIDLETGLEISRDEAYGEDCGEAQRDHKAALKNWRRRERAAERRCGYAEARAVVDDVCSQHCAAIEALQDARPSTFDELLLKARACHAHDGDADLENSLVEDVMALAGVRYDA